MKPIEKKKRTVGDRVCRTLIRLAPWEHTTEHSEQSRIAKTISLCGCRLVGAKLVKNRKTEAYELRLRTDDNGFTIFSDFAPKLDGRIHTGESEIRLANVNLEQSRALILSKGLLGTKKRVLTVDKLHGLLKEGACEFECELESYAAERLVLRGFLWKGSKKIGSECWIEVVRAKQFYCWNEALLNRNGTDAELPKL
jgi:hypothetical protein